MPLRRFGLPVDHAAFAPMTAIARIAIIAVTLALFLGSSLMALDGQRDLAVVFALATPLGISAWGFARAGHGEPALVLLSLVLIAVTTFVLALSPLGVHDVAATAYGGIVLVGALLLTRRNFYLLTAVTLIAACSVFTLDLIGITRSIVPREASVSQFVEFLVILAVFAVPGRYAAEVLVGSLGDVHRAAVGDMLTGLSNRAGFIAQAAAQLKARPANAAPVVLVLADLDSFRRVNVVIGHAAADLVLQEVARRLRETCGAAILARIGDDEFAALARVGDDKAGDEFARSVQNALSFEFSGVSVRSSIGYARSPRDAVGIEALLIAAETVLSQAKEQGGERFAAPADRL